MGEVPGRVIGPDSEGLGDGLVHSPTAGLDVVGRDERVRLRMVALLVDQPDRVEDLHGVVGVEARDDLRDRAEVAIDELA
jgi:hypothetical protein